MNTGISAVVALVGAGAVLSGCIFVAKSERPARVYTSSGYALQIENGGVIPGVREKRKDDLAKLNPGTQVAEFRKAFPDAIYVESRRVNGREWDAYSVVHQEVCQSDGSSTTFTHRDELWFYFLDGAYRGFGPVKQWPTDATEPPTP